MIVSFAKHDFIDRVISKPLEFDGFRIRIKNQWRSFDPVWRRSKLVWMFVEISRNHGFKYVQIIFYHRPNNIRIDAEIVMNKNISHTDYLLPCDLVRMRRGFHRQSPNRLADDL